MHTHKDFGVFGLLATNCSRCNLHPIGLFLIWLLGLTGDWCVFLYASGCSLDWKRVRGALDGVAQLVVVSFSIPMGSGFDSRSRYILGCRFHFSFPEGKILWSNSINIPLNNNPLLKELFKNILAILQYFHLFLMQRNRYEYKISSWCKQGIIFRIIFLRDRNKWNSLFKFHEVLTFSLALLQQYSIW